MRKDNFQYNIKPLSLNEKINFFAQLQAYMSASVPISTSLMNIKKYSNEQKIKQIATILLQDMDSGKSFSDSILKFKNTLGGAYCQILSIGEQSGALPKIINDIHSSLIRQQTVIMNLIKSSVYPAFLLLVLSGSSLLLIFFIAPRMAKQASMLGAEPSATMLALESLAGFLQNNYFALAIIFILAIYGIKEFFKYLFTTELGAKSLGLGTVIRNYNISNFTKILAISYSAGVPITHALMLSASAVPNKYMQNLLFKTSAFVTKIPLTEAFAQTGLFAPHMLTQIQAGELSGNLDKTLFEISRKIDENLETAISAILKILEPTLILLIGGFIVLYGVAMMGTIFMI